jgi:hypothetical protein
VTGKGEQAQRDEARRGTLGVSWVNVMGSALAVALFQSHGLPWGLWLLLCIVGAACLGVLLVAPRLPRTASLGLLSLQVLVALAAIWHAAEVEAASGQPFLPFNGNKILAFVVAIFCPSVRLGVVLIGLLTAEALVQTAHFAPAVRSLIPQIEPFQTLVIGGGALVFLIAHRRHAAAVTELSRVQAEQRWIERIARLGLVVRNLTQAPLEAVRNGLSTLRRQGDTDEQGARMERAVARLEQLNELLGPLDRIVPAPSEKVSLESVARLKEELEASRAQAPLSTHARAARSLPYREAQEEARRGCLGLGGVVATSAILLLLTTARGFSVPAAILLSSAGTVPLAVAIAFPRLPERAYQALFGMAALLTIFGILWNNDTMARQGLFDAFPGIKLFLFVLALFAASGPLGAVLIGLATIAPVAETYLWWSAEQRSRMPMLEPWPTVLMGLTAFGVLAAQRRHLRLMRELEQARATTAWMSRVARLVVSVRDFSNSPLQTLVFATQSMRHARSEPELDEIDAALRRLRGLNEELASLDAMVEKDASDLSFDALDRIATEVHLLDQEASRSAPR